MSDGDTIPPDGLDLPQLLYDAVIAGRVDQCAKLILQGASVHHRYSDHSTPLHQASALGNYDVVAMLLLHGSYINAATTDGSTPLMMAAKHGHSNICRVLVEFEADMELQRNDGCTALFISVIEHQLEACGTLSASGAKVNSPRTDGTFPLHIAAQTGQQNMCGLLLSFEATVDACTGEGYTPLCLAAVAGHLDICSFLLDHGANLHRERGERLLHPFDMAADAGQAHVCRLLLDRGAELCPMSLLLAARSNHPHMVQFLLDRGLSANARKDNRGPTPLYMAAQSGNLAVCQLLLDHKADVNLRPANSATALCTAASMNYTSICELLLRYGARVDEPDSDGLTALFVTTSAAVAEMLLQRGALANYQLADGTTPLIYSSENNIIDVTRLLLQYGVSVNYAIASSGLTALHTAAAQGHADVCRLLLDHGAYVDAVSADGRTPLCLATRIAVCELLISRGACPNAISPDTVEPLVCAAEKQQDAKCRLLIENGANFKQALRVGIQRGDSVLCEQLLRIDATVLQELPETSSEFPPTTPMRFETTYSITSSSKRRSSLSTRVDPETETPLSMAARLGYYNLCQLFLSFGAKPSAEALSAAAEAGYADICKLFLDSGISPGVALYYAAVAGHTKCCEVFLAHPSVDINVSPAGMTTSPIHAASEMGHVNICQMLIQKGARLDITDKRGYTPLFLAPSREVCQILIQGGASADTCHSEGVNPLMHSAGQGRLEVCEYLIGCGAVVNACDLNGSSALHFAVKKKHLEVAVLLLRHGAQVNQANINGITPLFSAAQSGYVEMCELLVERGAVVDAVNSNGVSPLCIASQHGFADVVKYLLENGANVNLASVNEVSPLLVAAQGNHKDICAILVKAGASIVSALRIAVRTGNAVVVSSLLQMGVAINDDEAIQSGSETLLTIAASKGHAAVCKLLIEYGSSPDRPNKHGQTPLCIAATAGLVDVASALVESGSLLDPKALTAAARMGHMSVCRWLIEQGCELDYCDEVTEPPLSAAARFDQVEVCQLLLEKGARVNGPRPSLPASIRESPDSHVNDYLYLDHRAPLLIAAQQGHSESCRVLLERDALVDACIQETGNTCLYIAAKEGHEEVCYLLLEAGASCNLINHYGQTPLFIAAAEGHVDVVRMLIQYHSNLDLPNHELNTPLIVAAMNNWRPVVRVLLTAGAALDRKNKSGRTAIAIAEENRCEGIVSDIKRYVSAPARKNRPSSGSGATTPLTASTVRGSLGLRLQQQLLQLSVLLDESSKLSGNLQSAIRTLPDMENVDALTSVLDAIERKKSELFDLDLGPALDYSLLERVTDTLSAIKQTAHDLPAETPLLQQIAVRDSLYEETLLAVSVAESKLKQRSSERVSHISSVESHLSDIHGALKALTRPPISSDNTSPLKLDISAAARLAGMRSPEEVVSVLSSYREWRREYSAAMRHYVTAAKQFLTTGDELSKYVQSGKDTIQRMVAVGTGIEDRLKMLEEKLKSGDMQEMEEDQLEKCSTMHDLVSEALENEHEIRDLLANQAELLIQLGLFSSPHVSASNSSLATPRRGTDLDSPPTPDPPSVTFTGVALDEAMPSFITPSKDSPLTPVKPLPNLSPGWKTSDSPGSLPALNRSDGSHTSYYSPISVQEGKSLLLSPWQRVVRSRASSFAYDSCTPDMSAIGVDISPNASRRESLGVAASNELLTPIAAMSAPSPESDRQQGSASHELISEGRLHVEQVWEMVYDIEHSLLEFAETSHPELLSVMAPEMTDNTMSEPSVENLCVVRLATLLKQRSHATFEILHTERTFVRRLESLITVFVDPLQTPPLGQKTLLPEHVFERLFPEELKDMLMFSKTLLEDMETVALNDPLLCISYLFLERVDELKIYSLYCNSLPGALAALEESLENSAQFAAFCESARSRCDGLSLDQLLMEPFQRICRYPLLLKAVLDKTPPIHPEYPTLKFALEGVKSVAEYVNESRRNMERSEEYSLVVKHIRGLPKSLEEHRPLYHKGALNSDQRGVVYAVLCDDVMMLMSSRGGHVRRRSLPTNTEAAAKVLNLQFIQAMKIGPGSAIHRVSAIAFTLESCDVPAIKMLFTAQDKVECDAWIKSVNEVMKLYSLAPAPSTFTTPAISMWHTPIPGQTPHTGNPFETPRSIGLDLHPVPFSFTPLAVQTSDSAPNRFSFHLPLPKQQEQSSQPTLHAPQSSPALPSPGTPSLLKRASQRPGSVNLSDRGLFRAHSERLMLGKSMGHLPLTPPELDLLRKHL